ncbi:MAG: hypothetical protein KF689_03815 [Gemmatimonadaceae bacterium]|nr:hypothetical protein [Gemmatimonadaceae bacterium]MCW5825692.1 hypothetical protein [Gemmatimonadaceae bacterium]
MRRRLHVALPLGAVLALGLACVNAPIARPLAAGNCRAAVEAFAGDLRAQNDPAALRLVARAYATPDCEAWAPDSAVLMLERATLIDGKPSVDDRRLDGLLRSLLGERERLRSTIALHERIVAASEEELAALRAERDDLAASALRSAEYTRSLQDRVAQLEVTLDGLRAQLQSLTEELEALKQVDLRGRPDLRGR